MARALMTYVAKLVEDDTHTLTVWADEIEPGSEYELIWDLIEDKFIKEPGHYLLAAPKAEENMVRGHIYTVTRNREGGWDVAEGLGVSDIRQLHRWPPR